MIASWVTYHMMPGTRERFCRMEIESGIYEKCQGDAILYEAMLPYDGSDRICFKETWTDDDQLKAHSDTQHVKDLQPLKAGYVIKNGCVGQRIDAFISIETD